MRKLRAFDKYSTKRLRWQRWAAFALATPTGYLILFIFKFFLGYRIENIKDVRTKFKNIVNNNNHENHPILICANHLTYIDSILILWALAPQYWYQFNPKYLSWNLPAGDFFGKMRSFRIFGFISKCIFIHRDGSSGHHTEILNTCKSLLNNREVVTIFIEGTRSRSGYFDPSKVTYGAGKIVQDVPNCRVLCAYVRGHKQTSFSKYPAMGSRFYAHIDLIHPTTALKGREGCAEIVQQIAGTIKNAENEYFSKKANHVSNG